MRTTVGTIGLNMVLNSSKFRTQINDVQGLAQKTSQRMSASFKKLGAAIAGAFSVALIKKFGQECVKSAASVQAANSQLEQTFGSLQEKAEAAMKKVADESGILQTRLQGVGTSIYAFAKASGMESTEALKMMQEALQVTADSAAYYDRSLEDTSESLKSFLKGNYANDAALGISCTETTRNAAANKLYGKSFKDLSEAQKQLTLLQMVKDANQLSGALGQAAREADGWENVTGNLKESWKQFTAVIGRPVLQIATQVVKKLSSAIAVLTEHAKGAVAALSDLFGLEANSVSADLSSAADSAGSVADEADAGAQALDGVTDSAEKAKRSLAGFDKLNVLTKDEGQKTESNSTTPQTDTNPKSTNLIKAMSSAVDNMSKTWDIKGKKLVTEMKRAFGNIRDSVVNIGNSWKRVWNNGTGKKTLDNIKTLLGNIFGIVGDITGAFNNAWNKADRGDAVVQSILDKWNSLVDLLDTIANSFREVWNDGTGERIWGNILDFITNCNNATKTLRDKIKEAWEKNEAGKKIWGTILGIVEDITGFMKDMSEIRLEWLEQLDLFPLVTAVSNLGEAFRELLKACGDKLKTVYKNILLPLSKWTIEKAVPKLVEMLAKALKFVADVVRNISDDTLYAIAGGITAVGTAVIVFKTGSAIAAGINKVKDALKVLCTTISANPLLAIASAISGVILAVETYNKLKWENSEAKKFCDEIDGYANQLEQTAQRITDNLESTFDELNNIYADNTLIDNYQEKLSELIQKAQLTPSEMAELNTIVKYFKDKSPEFEETWDEFVEVNSEGVIKIKKGEGDQKGLDDIIKSLDEIIDKYQLAAASSAVSSLLEENYKARFGSKEIITETEDALASAKNELDKYIKEYVEERNNNTAFGLGQMTEDEVRKCIEEGNWTALNTGVGLMGGNTISQETYDNLKNSVDSYDDLLEKYNNAVKENSKAIQQYNKLNAAQLVLNGDTGPGNVVEAVNFGVLTKSDAEKITGRSWEELQKTVGRANTEMSRSTQASFKDMQQTLSVASENWGSYGEKTLFTVNGVSYSLKDLSQMSEEEFSKMSGYFNTDDWRTWGDGVETVGGQVEKTLLEAEDSSKSADNTISAAEKSYTKHSRKMKTEGDNLSKETKESADEVSSHYNAAFASISLNCTEMWTKIKKAFTEETNFNNIKDAIWTVFKDAINHLIDGINSLIKGPFDLLSGAFDSVRNFEFFGNKVFDWLPHINAPQIPHLAHGGIVKAPTLAVVGDNAGANSGDPEVVSPLSKLQGMINTSSGQDVVILSQILDYLKRIYEMFVVFRNSGGNTYEFIAKLNGSEIFEEMIKQNDMYKKRHNGRSAFA